MALGVTVAVAVRVPEVLLDLAAAPEVREVVPADLGEAPVVDVSAVVRVRASP